MGAPYLAPSSCTQAQSGKRVVRRGVRVRRPLCNALPPSVCQRLRGAVSHPRGTSKERKKGGIPSPHLLSLSLVAGEREG